MAKLMDPSLDLHAQLEVLAAEGVATSEIEGEKFNPATLRSSLASRLELPTIGVPTPSRSVEGLVDVLLDATRDYNEPLTLARLCSWQAALFPTGRSGMPRERAKGQKVSIAWIEPFRSREYYQSGTPAGHGSDCDRAAAEERQRAPAVCCA